MKDEKKLLIFGDTPTVTTGFANVIRNLAKYFQPHFPGGIHIWGINYNGWPHKLPYQIYPAGFGDWASPPKMAQLLNLIYAESFTHFFSLIDCHNLAGELTKPLRQVLKHKNMHYTFYYPVDAPLETSWLDTVAIANVAVTYTDYGRRETSKARPGLRPYVLPHGVDTTVFKPLDCDRDELRKRVTQGWIDKDEVLLVNINRNERRKAPQHCLQITKLLREQGIKAKLYLHMPKMALGEHTDIELVAKQIGIKQEWWSHADSYFVNGNGQASEEGLNEIYNSADFVISTSLGEGWGLSLTEGAAAGTRVIAPDHTSVGEIGRLVNDFNPGQFTLLPLANEAITNMLDSSRVRYPVDIKASVELIKQAIATPWERKPMPQPLQEHLSWERIAKEFIKLMLRK